MASTRQMKKDLAEQKQLRDEDLAHLGARAVRILAQGTSWREMIERLGASERKIRRAIAKAQAGAPAGAGSASAGVRSQKGE
jgi:hypothetical protein